MFIVLDITDPLQLPLKRGELVCLLLEGSRKLLYKSLSVSLFRKKSNCLSLFRRDGRGVRNDEVFIVLDITDPLYLPLKRGGLVCPPLKSPVNALKHTQEFGFLELFNYQENP